MAQSPIPWPGPGGEANADAPRECPPPHPDSYVEELKRRADSEQMTRDLEEAAVRLVKDDGKAHDVVAEVKDYVFETRFRRYRQDKGTLQQYLKASVVHACWSLLKAEGKLDEWDDAQRPGNPRSLVVVEISPDLRRALDRLPPRDAEMLLRQAREGWTIAELAVEYRMQEPAVKVRLLRTKQRLRNLLQKGGYRSSADAVMIGIPPREGR